MAKRKTATAQSDSKPVVQNKQQVEETARQEIAAVLEKHGCTLLPTITLKGTQIVAQVAVIKQDKPADGN